MNKMCKRIYQKCPREFTYFVHSPLCPRESLKKLCEKKAYVKVVIGNLMKNIFYKSENFISENILFHCGIACLIGHVDTHVYSFFEVSKSLFLNKKGGTSFELL